MELQAAGQSATRPRVHVLAFPPPSTGHYIAFVLALLTVGLFVGNWLHNEAVGDTWTRAVLDCELRVPQPDAAAADSAVFARLEAVQQCQAPVERVRILWSLGGAAVVVAAALVLVYVRPTIVRRRRHLSEPVPKMAPMLERFGVLSREAGLRRAPSIFVGSSQLQDAFCFGAPGKYAIAMPRKLITLLQRQGVFDALVRHELAHIKHHDVGLAWLARSVWFVAGPLLVTPVLWSFIQGDYSLLPSYVWRAFLLGIVIELTSANLLRSREHDADLAAAYRPEHFADLEDCLLRIKAVPLPRGWRAALARHPGSRERLQVLHAPETAAHIRFVDAAAPAFLASLAVPLVVSTVTTLTAGTGQGLVSFAVAALLIGPVLAFTVGFALWRAELMSDAAAELVSAPVSTASRPAAVLGVGVGLAAGQLASLAQTGIDVTGLDSSGISILVPALLGMGTVGLAVGLSGLYVRLVRLARTALTAWGTAVVANVVLFTVSAWVWISMQFGLERIGWEGTRLWMVTGMAWPPLILGIVLLVCASLVGLWLSGAARGKPIPDWLAARTQRPTVEHPFPAVRYQPALLHALGTGLLVGILTAAVIVGWRLLSGPANTDAEREVLLWTVIWLAAGSWGAVNLAAVVVWPHSGGAISLAAGPLAVLTSLLGFTALNTLRGGVLSADFVAFMLWPALSMGFLFALVTSVLTALPRRPDHTVPSRANLKLPAISGTLAVCCAIGIIGASPALVHAPGLASASTAQMHTEEAELYALGIAQQFLSDYDAVDRHLQTANQLLGRDPAAVPPFMHSVVLPAVTDLRSNVEQYDPPTEDIRVVHAHLIRAMRLCQEKSELFRNAVEFNDQGLYEEALVRQDEEGAAMKAWISGVVALRSIQPNRR